MENKNVNQWKPVEGNIMTRWAYKVDPDRVLPEYPRPQMVRNEWINLNGLWDYTIRGINEEYVDDFDGKILVPFPIESALSGVKNPLNPNERLWYRRTFTIPKEWDGRKLLLHFGAIDWKAEVWINRKKAGEHTGGYYPFDFEISDLLVDGKNEIVVGVWDPTDEYGQERGKQVLDPKGIFYTPSSGIWQTVWLEPVNFNYIKSFKLTPDIDEKSIIIRINSEVNAEFTVKVLEKNKVIASGKGKSDNTLKLKIPDMKLWSPDEPFLYDIKISLGDGDYIFDEIISYFGMRKFSIEKDNTGIKRLFLNNKPLFQNGVLDQGYWPDGLYTAPADEALEYDVKMAKMLGFNMIRKHIKVEPARWYYHCDRLGLIVWQDMINGGGKMQIMKHVILPNIITTIKDNNYKAFGRNDISNRANYKKELKEMIDCLYNVTSIGMWVPFNEAWGQFDAAEIYEWTQSYDLSRCIDHASGWYDQKIGEIKSVHIYFRKLRMPKKIMKRAVAISEYGGYSLHMKGHVWDEDKEFGYKKFKSSEDLQKAYTSLVNEELKPLISKGVCAAVYTQLADVETEINGLMTYDREIIKLDVNSTLKLNESLIE